MNDEPKTLIAGGLVMAAIEARTINGVTSSAAAPIATGADAATVDPAATAAII